MSIRAHKVLLCAVLLWPLSSGAAVGQRAIENGDVEAARALLDQGKISINTEYTDVGTVRNPIQLAAAMGQIKIVELLLERGAKPDDVAAANKMTALMQAAWQEHLDIVKLLVARGADVFATTPGGDSALKLAETRRNDAIAIFLRQAQVKAGGDPSAAVAAAVAPPAPLIVVAPVAASDVDHLPTARNAKKKNAYAVVVGIGRYREKLPAADYADKDAELVGEYLTKVLGYPEENVIVRLNERATRTDLVKYFEEWLRNNVEPGASVFIYYSGHGTPNTKTGEAFLVPYDGDPTFVDSTAYPLKQLYAALDKLPAKDVTVVLDSCFSGAGGRSVLAKGARPMVLTVDKPVQASGKTVVLAASGGDEISNSFEEKGHGLMTYYFLKGLHGEADANKDGGIEMSELFDYVKPNVQRVARKQYNAEQTPQLLGSPAALKAGGRLVESSRH